MKQLKRIVVILGGIREAPMAGAVERRTYSTRRPRRFKGQPATEHRRRGTLVRLYPEEWKEAHCFVATANKTLKSLCYSTPIGRIALKEREPELLRLKESMLAEAVLTNSANPHWQVLDELCWTELDEAGKSELLRILGGDLPDVFWDQIATSQEDAT